MDESVTVEFEDEVPHEQTVELTAEWVAFLAEQPIPACVDGVDESGSARA